MPLKYDIVYIVLMTFTYDSGLEDGNQAPWKGWKNIAELRKALQ